jgi:phosphohistidine phosphatase
VLESFAADMKILYLLRHAKSSWDDPTLKDFARPLNKRGRKAAPLIGRFARERKIQPDVIISSPAERARETILLVAAQAHFNGALRFDERIYGASVERLREVAAEISDEAKEAMLVGHNPSLEEFLEYLTAEVRHLPTAALARISLNCEHWSDVGLRIGKLDWLVKPKELKH